MKLVISALSLFHPWPGPEHWSPWLNTISHIITIMDLRVSQVTFLKPLLWLGREMMHRYILSCPCQAAIIKGSVSNPHDTHTHTLMQTHTHADTHPPAHSGRASYVPLFIFCVNIKQAEVFGAFHQQLRCSEHKDFTLIIKMTSLQFLCKM